MLILAAAIFRAGRGRRRLALATAAVSLLAVSLTSCALFDDKPPTDGVNAALIGPDDQVFYQHAPRLGTVTLVTDRAGEVVSRRVASPFGVKTGHDGEDPKEFSFTGKEWDDETGYVYFGARYFDPSLGRWISADPLFLYSADQSAATPVENNLYVYIANTPTHSIDSDGTCRKKGAMVDCVSAAWERYQTLTKITQQSWDEGNYGDAAAGLALSTAQTVHIGAGFGAQELANAWNSGWNIGRGVSEGDSRKVATAGVNLAMVLAFQGKGGLARSSQKISKFQRAMQDKVKGLQQMADKFRAADGFKKEADLAGDLAKKISNYERAFEKAHRYDGGLVGSAIHQARTGVMPGGKNKIHKLEDAIKGMNNSIDEIQKAKIHSGTKKHLLKKAQEQRDLYQQGLDLVKSYTE